MKTLSLFIVISSFILVGCTPEQEATQYSIADEIILPNNPIGDPIDPILQLSAPVAVNQSISMYANQPKTFLFELAQDPDLDNEGFVYEIVEGPEHGVLTDCLILDPVYSTLDCTYTPNQDYVGVDSIKYKVTDDSGLVSETLGEVSITVYAPAQAPCDSQRRLSIFLDNNKNDIADEDEKLGEVSAYVGDISTDANYNYYSASAHPINGPTPSGYAGNVFFYNGSDGLSFNFFFNVDGGGSADNTVKWEISTRGNSNQDFVMVADDPNANELNLLPNPNAGFDKSYLGDWRYWSNTDGGAIGPFSGDQYEIKVKMLDRGDVANIKFYSQLSTANGAIDDDIEILGQDMGNDAPDTFFVRYADVEICE